LTRVSLLFHHVFYLIIHNQCSDFELVSPEYFGSNIIWHIPPDQKVNANAVVRASFGKNVTKREFSSALIYKLQRKKRLGSDADNTSTSHQLLVIWRSDNRYGYFMRVLLVKHSNTITLDENTLKELDYPRFSLIRKSCNIKNTWALGDATVLMTTSKLEKQIRTIEITISEGTREDDTMRQLLITSNM
jgi:hypothetical protein